MAKTTKPANPADDDRKRNDEPGRSPADEVASFVGHKAEEAASYVAHKAEDATSYAARKSDESVAAAGAGLRSLGGTIRERGGEGGLKGEASSAVADTLESTGRYLEDEGIQDMVEDLTALIRRHPIPALIVGVGAGYLLGKAMSPRS